jgi:hypothetical protein
VSSGAAAASHRIGRLRWQAQAPDADTARVLSERLRDATARISAALEQALDAVDPGDPGWVLHLRRMELKLPATVLDAGQAELREVVEALVRREWQALHGAPGGRVQPPPVKTPPHLLLDYLATGVLHGSLAGLAPERVRASVRAAALALVAGDDPLRLGMRAGDLNARVGWFRRLLELWPPAERQQWMQRQVEAAQGHAMAASPLHEALDRRLFDAALSNAEQVQLMALWLAVMAPGAVSLDAQRREADLAAAEALLANWLAPVTGPGG